MRLYHLFQKVSFEGVYKELILSDPRLTSKVIQLAEYFNTLKAINNFDPPFLDKGILTIDREDFRHAVIQFPSPYKAEPLAELKTFIPHTTFLLSIVDELDLKELDAHLIVAGAIYTLTVQGTCFNEKDRFQHFERLQEGIKKFTNP